MAAPLTLRKSLLHLIKMQPVWYLLFAFLLAGLILWFLNCQKQGSEKYVYTGVYKGDDVTGKHAAHNYKQMTLLPWCDRPISVLSPCNGLRRYYPGQRYPTGVYPISCPPGKVSIYETGNAENPNTISTWKLGKEINPVYR